ncbi:MAG: phosphotransferase [Planctomycetes bacterium]|nr:phosphotransferase [Planctomycetota bacterium]
MTIPSVPWQAERALDPAALARELEIAFPELAPVRARVAGEGFDNLALLANDRVVFRFPRRKIAIALLERERRALPAIAGSLNLQIPAPVYRGTTADGWPYSGYIKIEGEPASDLNLNDRERAACAPAIAEFLRKLHAIDVAAVADSLPGDELGRLDMNKQVPRARERMARLERAGALSKSELSNIREVIEKPAVPSNRRSAVVHGDFYGRHIIISNGIPSGAIDWGDIHLGDPALDLAILYIFFPPEARAEFIRNYGGADEPTLQLARFRATAHSLATLEYARDRKDADLEREARRAFL